MTRRRSSEDTHRIVHPNHLLARDNFQMENQRQQVDIKNDSVFKKPLILLLTRPRTH